jgi:hypothetical protein
MSDPIPRFHYGERVRIMQVDGVEPALHNRRGTVVSRQITPSHSVVRVALDDYDDHDETSVEVPVSCLMRIPRRLQP